MTIPIKKYHGRTELDSHTDATIPGFNCCIIHETGLYNIRRIQGTTIFNYTVILSDKKNHDYPHIILTSPNPWKLINIQFNAKYNTLEEE